MSRTNYDLLTGVREDKLNAVIAQAYGKPALRKSLFKGQRSGDVMGLAYTLRWEVKSTPTIVLRAPSSTDWLAAINRKGKISTPQGGGFLVKIDALHINLKSGPDKLDTTIPVSAIATAAMRGSKLSLTTQGVIVNLAGLSADDREIITVAFIPEVLDMLDATLRGLRIPQQSFGGQRMSAPVIEARDGFLLTAFNLLKDGTPSIGKAALENAPFFVRVSPELLRLGTDSMVRNKIAGKDFNQHGREPKRGRLAGFKAQYTVHGVVQDIRALPMRNPLAMRAEASLSMNASAGVDTPAAVVVDKLENVGKKIIDPDTWNPTKW